MIMIGVRAEENFDWAANILANIVCKDGFPNSHLYWEEHQPCQKQWLTLPYILPKSRIPKWREKPIIFEGVVAKKEPENLFAM